MHVAEAIYYLGLSAKKFHALRHRRRLPCRVLSIGNLTVGGTGKTPAVMAVAGEALKRGFCPVILTRGYGGRAGGPCFVTKGEGPLLTAEEAGDEPALMAERLSGVPIVKAQRRYEAGVLALDELGGGGTCRGNMLFILDDGFQHWALFRDRDVLLVDSTNPFGNGKLLPLGRLREPVSAVARADIVVLTRTGEEAGDTDKTVLEIRRHNSEAPLFFARHVPVSCRFLSGLREPFSFMSGQKVFGFCGLANPGSFRKTLAAGGVELTGFRAFRDHFQYTQKDVDRIAEEAKGTGAVWIATTEKDIIKARRLELPENFLIVEIDFLTDDSFYDRVFG